MIRCIRCDAPLETELRCAACGSELRTIEGITCYAPELLDSASGFRSDYFAELFRLESGNFWFIARNKLILQVLSRYCKDFESYLEIGCGTGYVLSAISEKFPCARIVGSEIFIAGLEFASQRIPSATLLQMDARRTPFVAEYELVGAFDVLEHIEEDVAVMDQVHQALKPGGHFLITVPQHNWLWSPVDEYAQHVRRYSRKDLHHKIEAAGFEIVISTSFVTSLLPAMWLSRLAASRSKPDDFDPMTEFNISPLLNRVLTGLLKTEAALIGAGLRLPIGGSRLVLARKA